jgi:2-keto-4-pentenoate hydratase
MTPIDAAATELARRRLEGRRGPRLDPAMRPLGVEDALVIQRRLAARLGEIRGWKCSLPPPGRVNLAPLFGFAIHRGRHAAVHARDSTVPIEPEIAFVLGRDLPAHGPAPGEAEVRAAIAETRLVVEVIGNRYDDPQDCTPAEMLADCANNEGLVVGPVLAQPHVPLEAFSVTVSSPNGFHLERAGRHPDGHPLRPLVWLAGFLQERGEHLRAGQIVTTGSYAGVLDVPLATPLTVTFGTLGAVELTLDPAR